MWRLIFVLLFNLLFITNVHSDNQSSIKAPGALWAFADTHGAYDEFVRLLQSVQLIDSEGNWKGGNAYLVSTGDVLDRGPHPRKIFDLMMRLEKQAKEAGGGFHFTLGNHEVMILTGDLRYVATEEYAEFAADENQEMRDRYFEKYLAYHAKEESAETLDAFNAQHPAGFFARYEAFRPDGYYGRWLLQKNIVLEVNGNVFTHGGLSPTLKGKSLDDINRELKSTLISYVESWHSKIARNQLPVASSFKKRRNLILNAEQQEIESFKSLYDDLLFSNQSPTWYRGDAYCHPYYETTHLRELLGQFGAKRLFVGHTPTNSRQVERRLSDQVYLLDTGMLSKVYNGIGSIAKISPDTVEIFDTQSRNYSGLPGVHRPSFYPEGINNQQLESVLKTAEVEKIEKLDTGITEPLRLTFTGQEPRIRAVFKDVDETPKQEKKRFSYNNDEFSDKYEFDIAAYRISDLLGFNMVPVAVERQLNKKMGVVQFWVEDSYSQYTAEEKGWDYEGHCDFQAQKNMMNVFDMLIHNKDRNTTNYLIEQHHGQMVWIDHSRSFTNSTNFPKHINRKKVVFTPEVIAALNKLTSEDAFNATRGLLKRKQVQALMRRKTRLLKLAKEAEN